MFWVLTWCVAIACGGLASDPIATRVIYTKDQCIAEANKRLAREPQIVFICVNQNVEKAQAAHLMNAITSGNLAHYKPLAPDTVTVGPRTLSY